MMVAGCKDPGTSPASVDMTSPLADLADLAGAPDLLTPKTFSFARKEYPLGKLLGKTLLIEDFNNDGNLDILAQPFLMLGDGAGGFGLPVELSVGAGAAADFNGDHKMDVAWTQIDKIRVALGDGAGGFAAPIDTPTLVRGDSLFGALAAGDLNGDGIVDLTVTGSLSPLVGVLLGTGLGTFSPITAFDSVAYSEYGVVADFNGDKNLDYASFFGSAAALFGDGKGGLGPMTTYPVGGGISPMAVGDYDGDSKLDLATIDKYNDKLTILLNDGTGRFSALPTMSVGDYPRTVVTGDFNGDKKLDLAVENRGTVTLSVFFGDGLGSFGAPSTVPLPAQTCGMATGDFDKDGVDDLAVACDKILTVLLSR